MMPKELRQLEIAPFDCGVMDSAMTEQEDKAQLAVMLRYLDLLARLTGVPFDIPLITACLKRGKQCRSVYSEFHKPKTEIMRRLYDNIMLGTGWSYGVCKMDGRSAADRKPELSENCGIRDWEQAVSMVPEILSLEQKGFRDIAVTVCWSARIARYCEYAALNPEEVETVFKEEAAMIGHILREMADPYGAGSRIQNCQSSCYVMAYYEGKRDEGEISSDGMDYNFFVQGIVLHLLLSHAEELFGLSGHTAGE